MSKYTVVCRFNTFEKGVEVSYLGEVKHVDHKDLAIYLAALQTEFGVHQIKLVGVPKNEPIEFYKNKFSLTDWAVVD
jgi:hypothetical protein